LDLCPVTWIGLLGDIGFQVRDNIDNVWNGVNILIGSSQDVEGCNGFGLRYPLVAFQSNPEAMFGL
jgi:hypothetical protein